MAKNLPLTSKDNEFYAKMLEVARKKSGIEDMSLPQLVRRAMRELNQQEGWVEDADAN